MAKHAGMLISQDTSYFEAPALKQKNLGFLELPLAFVIQSPVSVQGTSSLGLFYEM